MNKCDIRCCNNCEIKLFDCPLVREYNLNNVDPEKFCCAFHILKQVKNGDENE